MKLLNRSISYLTLAFFIIIGCWSVLFYFNLKDEIRDSIDDGLENNKLLILQKIRSDKNLLLQLEFGGNNFKIIPIKKPTRTSHADSYKDTMMYRLNEDDLEPVRLLHTNFELDEQHYKLTIISSLVEEDDLIEDSFWSVVWLFILLIASIIIINNIVLRKVWTPFYAILEQFKTYRLDVDEPTIKSTTNIKEFTQLLEASNTLIRHSKEAYISQKQFTENASHELQTPIAIITNKLELLLESDHLIEQDAKSIAQVINITNRLKKLNSTLLLLAKIDNKQFLELKVISINDMVHEFLTNYTELADFKNIDFKVVEDNQLTVNMNSSLLEILISNLIRNSFFHNVNDGKISVKITAEELIISNTGNPNALASSSIFNRFVKDQTNTKNTGLGLSVSKAICDSYNMKLSYHFEDHQHYFTVNFKNCIPYS